jgi:hypothetical protein
MTRFISLAMLALVVPVAAQAQEQSGVTVQNARFTYTETQVSADVYKLEGRTADGCQFRFFVKGRRVSGRVDGNYVQFVMPEKSQRTPHQTYALNR